MNHVAYRMFASSITFQVSIMHQSGHGSRLTILCDPRWNKGGWDYTPSTPCSYLVHIVKRQQQHIKQYQDVDTELSNQDCSTQVMVYPQCSLFSVSMTALLALWNSLLTHMIVSRWFSL